MRGESWQQNCCFEMTKYVVNQLVADLAVGFVNNSWQVISTAWQADSYV